MKGVILAGGTGSRLFPLTKVTNKHLLPVGREPMIYHPVRKLTEAGIDEICIVTEVVAKTQEIADLIARFTLYRMLFPTFAGQKATAGGIAMLRDEVLRGQPAYRWTVDHLLPVADPLELYQHTVVEIN